MKTIKEDEAQKQDLNVSLTAVGIDAAQRRMFSEIKNQVQNSFFLEVTALLLHCF